MNTESVESIVRFAALTPSLATSGQPTEGQLAAVARAGYEVVINLALHNDPRYSLPDEPGTVKSLGLEYVHIPVQFSAPTKADLQRFFAAMDAAQSRRVLVHCAHNKRVPVFLALYRILRLGWSREEAFVRMRELWQREAVWEQFLAESLPSGG